MGEVEDFAEIPLVGPMPPGMSHLAVPARSQIAMVQVRMWSGAHPDVGAVVFNTSLHLPDGAIAVFDVDRTSRFERVVGKAGKQHLMVRVDDSRHASMVDVVVNPGSDKVSLSRVEGYAVAGVDGVSGNITPAEELSLILAGNSIPEARLVNALNLIIAEWNRGADDRQSRVNHHRILRIVEWLKGVYPEVHFERWVDISRFIEGQVLCANGLVVEGDSVSLAKAVIRRVEEFYKVSS
ncbi:hypothetical protein ACWCQ1_31145 [Streptomyces sp. NPDC002144]